MSRLFWPGSRAPGRESFEEVAAHVTRFLEELTARSLGTTSASSSTA